MPWRIRALLYFCLCDVIVSVDGAAFRNIKSVSAPALNTMVASHLAPYPPNTPVDDLVACYNTALALSLDALAPLKIRTVYHLPCPMVHCRTPLHEVCLSPA